MKKWQSSLQYQGYAKSKQTRAHTTLFDATFGDFRINDPDQMDPKHGQNIDLFLGNKSTGKPQYALMRLLVARW